MTKKKLNFPACLVLFSLSVLLLMPNSSIAEGDGGWTTAASPGHIFQIEEDLYNNQKHLVMTVLKADGTHEVHWGPTSGSVNSTYLLKSMNGESDMKTTWQFNSVTQATVTVESCTTNCLWQTGQVVTLNKFFGDKKSNGTATRVPKTGQTECWDEDGNSIDCTGTGQDGEYQLGVLPAVPPSYDYPYTVHGWSGTRFTDNLNGTVTDNLTGLIWLKNANCFGGKSWDDALNVCNSLASGLCGLKDESTAGNWRLPNANELHSLVDPTRDPALPAGHPFTGVKAVDVHWTSTTDASDPTEAWFVFFGFLGAESPAPKKGSLYLYSVWPVRSGS